jgi:hypothetical protein
MATQDDFVKTALRLPRELHAEIQAAALAAGRSMNAEIIGRLQTKDDAASLLLERLRTSEDELLKTTKKQIEVLWGVIDRTGRVLDQMDVALARAETSAESEALQQNIVFLRELIETIKAHR